VTPKAVELIEAGGAPASVHAIDTGDAVPRLHTVDAPYEAAPIDGRRVGLIQFTSGSTGMPKGVQLHEGSVATLGACCASRWLLNPADGIFGVFSLSHNAGTTFTTLAAFAAGAAMVFPAGGWSGGQGASVAQRTGTTVLPGVDTVVADLVASGVRWSELRLLVGGYDSATVGRGVVWSRTPASDATTPRIPDPWAQTVPRSRDCATNMRISSESMCPEW
jgi:acyl-CoA synthetase (AMP-forming)/AMP-acid ligase II